jgi:anthranilate/para-aminobenzoate synthase component I
MTPKRPVRRVCRCSHDRIEFNRLAAEGYNRIPVTLETFADLDTPLSIYLKLANDPYSYLLESVQGGERFGRYSFIGLAAGTRIAWSMAPSWCSPATASPSAATTATR